MTDTGALGLSGRMARFFLHSRLTPLVGVVALLLGLFAVAVTPREEEPQIDVTMANVFVSFPGASADDVERLIAIPAEQVLSQIQGLDHVWSVSKPGQAMITVQYKVGVSRNDAVVRLHETILSHRDWLPPELDVGEPLVKPKGIDDVPIVAITLYAKDHATGASDLQRVAHAVEAELKRVPGTREVTTLGGPGREVRVELDPAKLAAHGLDVPAVRNMLRAANVALPAGDLVRGNATVRVDAGGFLASARDVRDLVVAVHGGQPVFLSDVANVVDGPPQPARYAWQVPGKAGAGDQAGGGVALPAVTLPALSKAGRSPARPSALVLRLMNSSAAKTTGSPFFCARLTGVISASKNPACCARTALRCERSASSSCAARSASTPTCGSGLSAIRDPTSRPRPLVPRCTPPSGW